MQNVLVAVENYPNNNGGVALAYVHTRNKAYALNGIDVTVLSFCAKEDYIYDDIRVITIKTYLNEKARGYMLNEINKSYIHLKFMLISKGRT